MDRSILMTLLPIAVLGIVLALRIRSMSKERPLNLRRMWVLPALLVAIAAMTFTALPPDGRTLAWAALALIIGAALGWYRGKTIAIHHDPATGQLTQKPSMLGLLLVGAIIALKFGAKTYLGIDPAHQGSSPDPAATMFTDILLAFAIGLLSATQAELTIRARRMMARP